MSKDIAMMEKIEQVDELIHKAINEWNRGEPNKAVYNDCLRKARHLIFEAYFSEMDSC